MAYKQKIVLHCVSNDCSALDALVEEFIRDGVKFVGVVGINAALVEEIIDELVVGDGSDDERFILTSRHEGQTLEQALEFAHTLTVCRQR